MTLIIFNNSKRSPEAIRNVSKEDEAIYYYDAISNKLHSHNDLPSAILKDGSFAWHHHGKIHRDFDRPAIITKQGHYAWYQHGKKHRTSGPAVIFPDGKKEYWLNGTKINDEYQLKMATISCMDQINKLQVS